jgi:hypothetical protein
MIGMARHPTGPARRAAAAVALLLVAGAGVHASPAAAPDAHWPYVVANGDTLIGIARTRLVPGADWRVVQRLNQVRDPFRLRPGSTLLVPWELVPAVALLATVQHVHGDVQLERGGAPARALRSGDTVSSGALLATGANSSASLRLADGTRVLLRPQTRLQIETIERQGAGDAGRAGRYNTRLHVLSGAIDTQAPQPQRLDAGAAAALPAPPQAPLVSTSPAASPVSALPSTPAPTSAPTWRQLEIRTPVANLGVRGTEFRTRAEAQNAWFEVLEGQVGTRAAGGTAQALAAGQGQAATREGLLPPARLLAPPQWPRMEQVLRRAGEPLTLQWSANDPATRQWRVQAWAQDGAEPVLRLDARVERPEVSWPDAEVADLPSGAYEWRVRGIDAQGLEGLDARLAARLVQLPAAPPPPPPPPPRVPPAPTLRPVLFGSDGLLLRWDRAAPSAGAAVSGEAAPLRWRVQWSRVPGQDTTTVLTDQQSLLLGHLAAGRWQWRVRAESPAHGGLPSCAGPWSRVQTFDLVLPTWRWWWAPGSATVLPADAAIEPAAAGTGCAHDPPDPR